ncbi:MAG: hypothetical protein PHT24_00415 [Endomicrobiaceae bacterium]|nr:hypothetical protein [Endomicrobiaceae bacterium]
MNFKKITYFLLSVLLLVLLSIFLFELILQILPLISKNISKNDKTEYVYILGESSAKGIPYHCKISFPKILEYTINYEIDGKQVKLIDLANVGNRLSHQYFSYFLYRYTHPFRKGIVLLYAGTNDTSGNYLNKNYCFIYNSNLIKIFTAYTAKAYDFQYMYENIIRLTKKFGDDIYISTIAGNYAGFMPENSAYLKKHKDFYKITDLVDKLFIEGDYKKALSVCFNNIRKYKETTHVFYRIGKIYEKLKKNKEANNFYFKAVDNDKETRPRPKRYQNEIIIFLANKYNISYLDMFGKLYNSDEVIGYNFFIDKIHPTIRLNVMLANGFIDLLSKKYKLKKTNTLNSDDDVKKIFNFTNEDLFATYIQALGEVFIYTYKNNMLNKYSLPQIKEYILIVKNLNLEKTYEEEQKKTIEFFETLLEYITNASNESLKSEISKLYDYGAQKKYLYYLDLNFKEMLKENKIIN